MTLEQLAPKEWGADYGSVDGNTPPNYVDFVAAGGRFVWIRGSFCEYDPRSKAWHAVPDSHLYRDWRHVPAHVTRGSYWIVCPQASQSPEEQVAVFAKSLEDAGGLHAGVDFPPCIDVEFPQGIKGTGMDAAGVMKWLRAAIAAMRATFKVAPIIYTSQRVWCQSDTDCLGNPAADDLKDLVPWLARYAYPTRQKAVIPPPNGAPPMVPLWGWWGAWQDQGDALHAAGFTSTVDIDQFHSVGEGDSNTTVAYYQAKLDVDADGKFGPKTAEAVREVQDSAELPVTGRIDSATGAMLMWRGSEALAH